MPGPLRIGLRNLGAAAYLESAGGVVVEVQGRTLLNGAFRLVIGGKGSDPVNFAPSGPAGAVLFDAGGYILVECLAVWFSWATAPLHLQSAQGGGRSPWLSSSRAWLAQPPKRDAMAQVSLQDVSVSLIGDAAKVRDNVLIYPTKNGPQLEQVSGELHPEDPNVSGYFVVPFEGGQAVSLGTVGARVNLSHAQAFDVGFQRNASSLWFRLTGPRATDPSLVVRKTQPSGVFVVGTTTVSGLAMALSPGASKWGNLLLLAESLEAAAGQLRISKFAEQDVWIGRVKSINDRVDDASGIHTSTSRLELSLELPLSADLTARLPNAALTYRDGSVAAPVPPTAIDRHFGVRVKGLRSLSGGPATLDADVAVFQLVGSLAAAQFELSAGAGVGVLAPKRRQRGTREERVLEIPVGDLAVQIASNLRPLTTPMTLHIGSNVAANYFKMIAPTLVSAPVGVTSKAAQTGYHQSEEFKRWTLALQSGGPEMTFDLADAGIKPQGDWVARFTTADPSAGYALLDHPGAAVTIDPPAPAAFRGVATTRTGFTKKVHSPTGKETAVYSAFFIALGYIGVRAIQDGSWSILDSDNFTIDLSNLDSDLQKDYVKEATAKGLQVVYFITGASPPSPSGAVDGLRKFIETNRLKSKKPDAKHFLWPFALNLSVQLAEVDSTGRRRYADEIAQGKRKNAQPGIGFDMSGLAQLNPTWLNFGSWTSLAKADPDLWPRADGRAGARLDPSDPLWRGVILRDLALYLPIPPVVGNEAPWIKSLVDKLNLHLMLDYAYRDEAGVTWKGGISRSDLPPGGLKVDTRPSWDGVFELFILGARVRGAANAIVSTDVATRLRLPRIKDKKGNPLELVGAFGIDLDKPNPIGRIELAQSGAPIETADIPGFDSVALRRIVTDLKTAQIDLTLVASPALAEALPFLSGKPQDAVLAFDLTGDPSAILELALPAEVSTNLFGRWPLTVQSMRIEFGSETTLRIVGRLSLGVGGFSSIEATVSVTRRADRSLDFDLTLQALDVGLSLGDMRLKGGLSWGEPGQPTKTSLVKAGEAGRSRDFWGYLKLDGKGFIGPSGVIFRAGNKGEVSYWVASIESKASLSLGIGQLENPGLLLAQNADLDGNLRKLALTPTGTIFKDLRPNADFATWLKRWVPSADIGSIVAGSGYFSLDKTFVKSPVKDPTTLEPDKLSGILYIDTGVLRVDGIAALITSEPAHFAIAVDFRERTCLIGLQTGSIGFSKYQFNPGYLTVGFGFGGKRYLDIRLGWPEPIAGSEFERDWSRALYFHADDLPWPVNTGWGGMKVTLDNDTLTVGVAFRCGWTKKSGDVSGGTGGGFDIGYAVGGLVLFSFPLSFSSTGAYPRLIDFDRRDPADEQRVTFSQDYIELAEGALLILDQSRNGIRLRGELFGDVWGSAWIRFMGVTLASIELKAFARYRICGSLQQGVTDARARCGFSVSVTILCVTYSTTAQYDIVIIDGDCMPGLVLSSQHLQGMSARAAAEALLQIPPGE